MLIFDGDCGFCTSSAKWAARGWRGDQRAVPWQRLDGDQLADLGLTPEDCRRAAWWVDDRGQLLRGHRAVAKALEAGGGWRRPAGVAIGWPPLSWIAAGVYRLVSKYRHRLPGGTPACRVDPDPSRGEQLADVLVHGLQPVWVEVVEYDPRWPAYYDRYAAGIRAALGERVRLIEHIGSTSVPGLAAKPVIDIVVGIDDPEDEAAYLPDLAAHGYDVRVREVGHRCLRGGDPEMPVNLHCYRPDSPEVDRYLRLRDWLRSNQSDRDLYAATKRELAGREWPDMNFYADAKSPVIADILRRAERGS